MPTVSFVVIAYNVERFIMRCLESLRLQTFQDFEVIIVNDASTDDTLLRINEFIQSDQRFTCINKTVNEGAHLARRTGALSSTGRYVIFVDGDDELSADGVELLVPALEREDNDIVRFGRTVIPASADAADERFAFDNERMFNGNSMRLQSKSILRHIFSAIPQRSTWSIIDCAFNGDFVRAAFGSMTSIKMGRMQDSYEMFVLCAQAKRMRVIPDLRVLRYYLGAGVSGRAEEPLERFVYLQNSAKLDKQCVESYVKQRNDSDIDDCAQWLCEEYLNIIGNEWVVRLSRPNQINAIPELVHTWGEESTCSIVLNPLLARGQWVLEQQDVTDPDDEFFVWYKALSEHIPPTFKDNAVARRWDSCKKLAEDIAKKDADIVAARLAEERKRKAEAEARIEAQRLAKSGTFARKLVDGLAPEQSMRRDLVRVLTSHLRHR